VPVGAATAPTVDFTFSPTAPTINQDITFVATAQSSVPGHAIVRYDWNFGSGSPQSGQVVTKAYDTPGTYNVTLTVTDDLGLTKIATKQVPVVNGPGGLFATFTVSPSNPKVGQNVFFNAGSSTGNIVRYDWDFGDGTTVSGTSATQSHVFGSANTFVVRLTVVDASGRTNTTTQNLAIAP